MKRVIFTNNFEIRNQKCFIVSQILIHLLATNFRVPQPHQKLIVAPLFLCQGGPIGDSRWSGVLLRDHVCACAPKFTDQYLWFVTLLVTFNGGHVASGETGIKCRWYDLGMWQWWFNYNLLIVGVCIRSNRFRFSGISTLFVNGEKLVKLGGPKCRN